MAARLKEKYQSEVQAKLMERFGISNKLAAPKLTRIVVNMGCKGAVENKSRIDAAVSGGVKRTSKTASASAGMRLTVSFGVRISVVEQVGNQ